MSKDNRLGRDGSTPEIGYRTITPQDAQKILDRSKRHNRPISNPLLNRLSKIMKDGQWDPYNSSAVSIDWDNNIVNGHHRLRACSLAGVPFRTLFIEGVPPETFANEDTGMSRNSASYFAILGEKNYIQLAAAVRSLLMWEQGQWDKALSALPTIPVTNEELRQEVERRPSVRQGAAFVSNHTKWIIRRLPVGLVGALWTLTKGHPKHDDFWLQVVERVGVDKDSPVRLFNNRIDAVEIGSHRLKRQQILALMTKTWNAVATDQKVVSLAFRPKAGESFPEPITKLKAQLIPPPTAAEAKAARRAEIEDKQTKLQ